MPVELALDVKAGITRSLSSDPLTPTVFHNPWWLEVASGGRYRELEVRSGGRVVARLPYVVERDLGHNLCLIPELTHFLGPAVDTGDGGTATRALKHYRLTQELISQLGSFGGFYHRMHRGVPDTLAFEAAGFVTQVIFTYEIRPKPLAVIWSEIRDKTRNVIRRALDNYAVQEWQEPSAFAAVYDANLNSRGLVNSYRRIKPVCEAALLHRQGRILAARNKRGAILGAIFVVWDQQSMYYLLSTRSVEADNSVMSLLVWQAICLASEAGLVFDFDGLGPSGNRLFYTGFGGQITPRYAVSKHALSYRALRMAQRTLKRLWPD